MRKALGVASIFAGLLAAQSACADVTVGFITSLGGAGSSIGIPYGRGVAAGFELKGMAGTEKIRLIQLDDASDPSAATRAARKLVEEEKVDVLIGTATSPSTNAIAAVATELKVPFVGIAPVSFKSPSAEDQWVISVPHPATMLVKIVTDRMKRDNMKNVGFIGFSDAWGDLVYNGAKEAEARGDIKLMSNERYARTDTSVTAQILKVTATRPEAVLNGGSGTQGALPLLALAERGYKGRNYGTVALINADFVRVGGKSVEGIEVSSGPSIVADQLPNDHFSKKITMAFQAAHEKVSQQKATDIFSAYAFDGWLVVQAAAERAVKKGKPGTPEFRKIMADEIFATKDLPGTQAIYSFKRGETYGANEASLIMVRLKGGNWVYSP